MWRSAFLAVGAYACLLGAECLVIDKAVLAPRGVAAADAAGATREVVPAEWAPWSLMSVGAVTMLYSFTLRRSA